jgi:predicted permease
MRLAARRLLATPAFTLAGILTLAVAMVPSLFFAAIRAAVVPPLPLNRPQELVAVGRLNSVDSIRPSSYPKFRFLRAQAQTMELAAWTWGFGSGELAISETSRARRAWVEPVSDNLFGVLQLKPLIGRFFTEEEMVTETPVVVVSEELWRSSFGGLPGVLGTTVRIDGTLFTIVGVMPGSFSGVRPTVTRGELAEPVELWIPLTLSRVLAPPRVAKWLITHPVAYWVHYLGRIKAGASMAQSKAEMARLSRLIEREWARTPDQIGDSYVVRSLGEFSVNRDILFRLGVLRFAGILILLAACGNVGLMFVSRGLDRIAPSAVRVALGAPRWVLVRQDLIESLFFSAAGAVVALAVVAGLVRFLSSMGPEGAAAVAGLGLYKQGLELAVSPLSLGVGIALLSTLVVGVLPSAARARVDPGLLLRGAPGQVTAGGFRSLRPRGSAGVVVVAQVAAAVALVLPSVLLLKSLDHLLARSPGFEPDGVFTAKVPAATVASVDGLLSRAREISGVGPAGFALCLPYSQACSASSLKTVGSGIEVPVTVNVVTPDLLRTLGIPIVRGRGLGDRDALRAPKAVLLSEAAARRLGANVIGMRVTLGGYVFEPASAEIVGVVGDVQYEDAASTLRPTVYLSYSQAPFSYGVLAVKGGGASLAKPMRDALAAVDPTLSGAAIVELSSRLRSSLGRFRIAVLLLALSAALGVLLAMMGIYGLVSGTVRRSRRELAVRVVLGADSRAVYWLVTRTALRLAYAGTALGVACGILAAGRLGELLQDVSPWDVAAAATAVITAVAMALIAAFVPAYRAAQVPPAEALRQN